MDVTSLKIMLGLQKTNKHDDYLNEVLPLFEEIARTECRLSKDAELPASVKLYIAKAIEYNMKPSNLKNRSMGSVIYGFETNLPRSITRYLAPHRKLRAR